MPRFPFNLFSSKGPRRDFESAASYEPGRWDDEYCNSASVHGLGENNFDEFLRDKDLALVFFYHPMHFKTDSSRDVFVKVAESSKKHSFGAVNCLYEPDVCSYQRVRPPFLKLYSRGRVVSYQPDPSSLLKSDIKKWMECFGHH